MEREKINIDSKILEKPKESLNQEITKVLSRLYEDEFDKGCITFKIQIDKKEGKEIYYESTSGAPVQKEKTYDKPTFKSTVSSVLKLENKVTETYDEEKRLVKDEDGFSLEDIINPQINLNELNKNSEQVEEVEDDELDGKNDGIEFDENDLNDFED